MSVGQKRIDIQDIVLDFDGTCTQISPSYEAYLNSYYTGFASYLLGLGSGQTIQPGEWQAAQEAVRLQSPTAGWMLASCPAAPAAADPYILADESARHILRQRKLADTRPPTLHSEANEAHLAPWRSEVAGVFAQLMARGIRLHFISNSSTALIERRLHELALSATIQVQSGAAKFQICEPAWDAVPPISQAAAARFACLPAAYGTTTQTELGRPVYLRRGKYFESICRVLDGDMNRLATTVFCGDIWEMDLAMPYALGACVHLLERAVPFATYPYEKQAVAGYGNRAKTSEDLKGLLDWLHEDA